MRLIRKVVNALLASSLSIWYCISILIIFNLVGCQHGKQQNIKKISLNESLFPPADLYDLLLDQPLNISSKSYQESTSFQIQHPGLYSIGLFFEKFPVRYYKSSYSDLKLQLKINCFDQEQLVFSQKTGEPILHFVSKQGRGLWLSKFYSPDEIPLVKNIQCKIEVLTPDAFFEKRYGAARLFVKRISEK